MRQYFGLLGFAFLLLLQGGRPATAQDIFRVYQNSRYDFSVEYPVNLVEGRPEAEKGRAFVSRGGSITLVAYGGRRAKSRTLSGFMSDRLAQWKQEGARVTYSRWKDHWIAISGYVGDKIFYERAIERDGTFATIVWRYPRELRKPMDAAVAHSLHSLAFNNGDAPTVTPEPARSKPTAAPTPAAGTTPPVAGY